MTAQVRRFTFFDKEAVKDPETGQPYQGLESLSVSASATGRGVLTFGDMEGFVHFVDRSFQITTFKAFQIAVSHLVQLRQSGILISVGNDEEGICPCVKVWNMDKVDRGGGPKLVRTIKIVHKGRGVAVSSVATLEDLSHLAVGLVDGTVLLFKGDLAHESHSNKAPRVLHEGQGPVTGLHFRPVGDPVLFVVTATAIHSYALNRKDHREDLEGFGCALGCSVINEVDATLVVGRPECVYSYEAEGRGGALGFDGSKKRMAWFRNYLVIVGNEPTAAGSTQKIDTVTIYDTRNKFIAFAASLTDVTHVFSEWGSLFVLQGDGKLFQLAEKDFRTKLDILYKKHLYDIAIALAKTQQSGDEATETLVEIYQTYASHLYSKSSYNEAIAQYIKTIGSLEPSYVIRKFLDSQRIHNLTAYLQALHERELADKHHTTLLLNCYTKLKDVKKLDEFIKTDKHLNFDLETAIKVCRQAGYFSHATFLAKKFRQHDWFLKIALEDEHHYQEALDYIATMSFADAARSLRTYGKELVNELPETTTELLKLLCTGYTPKGADAGAAAELQKASPEEFIHIYVNQMGWLLKFLEHMVRVQPNVSPKAYDTLLELYLRPENLASGDARARENRVMDLLQNSQAQYDDHHAMVLTQIYDFKPGILYLYEKAKQFQQIVQYYMEKNAYTEIIEACKKYGAADLNLWVQALSYFAGKEEDCKGHISEVLAHIDKRNLLPPLLVVDALARNSTATLSVVKDYITRRLSQENQAVAENERRIRQYREETARMRAEIAELKTKAKIFQDMRCTNCKSGLDLPAVHFLCGHSYHQRCLVGDTEECTLCADDRRKVADIVRAQGQAASEHEQFFKQLDGAASRFGVVADYFGRGLFNKITLLTDAPGAAAGPAVGVPPSGLSRAGTGLAGAGGPGAAGSGAARQINLKY